MAKSKTLYFHNNLYDDQFARTLAASASHMSDFGECYATARVLRADPTPDTWYSAWAAIAEDLRSRAQSAHAAGHPVTARNTNLRASEYARQAFFFLRHNLDDSRLQHAYRLHVEAFAAASPVFGVATGRRVSIPYEGTLLHGWFYSPNDNLTKRPTVILPDGYDSTAEEMFSYGFGALERGYNVVCFDGPGQGEALYCQRLFMRADFEVVLTAVIDWLVQLPEVDESGLVLVGRSFAGYLAPRAAAFEHRIAALVCDPPDPNLGSHVPDGLIGKIAAPLVELEQKFSADKREFFGARMATHGVSDMASYLDVLRSFDMLAVADKIKCPTLLVECEGDPLAGKDGARVLAAAMQAPTTTIKLSAASGAGGHCGGLGQRVWDAAVYDWIDEILSS